MKSKAPTCWHCEDTNKCGCYLCLIETVEGRMNGPCQVCKGRKRSDALRPFLEANNIEPGDIQWWTRNHDGKLVFIGHQLFDRQKAETNK